MGGRKEGGGRKERAGERGGGRKERAGETVVEREGVVSGTD